MRSPLTLIFLCTIFTSEAQILNVESLRKVTDTSGFAGSISATLALKRNVNDFVVIRSDIHLQYKMKEHLFLFKNDVSFVQIEGDEFDNSLISHVRYNYRFHPRIAWEIFAQGQFNKVNLIDFRGLLGTGPRFKLSTSEKYKFYLGALMMYEHERLSDGVTPTQRDFRASAYLSFSLYPTENITIVSTTYGQPRVDKLDDFRISSQSSLIVGLLKNFALNMTYSFTYDAFPAVGVPKSQYDFSSGFTYSFD